MRAGELGPFWAIIRAIALCPVLAGCIVGIPSLGEPSRMLTVTDEIPPVGTVENRLFEQYLATVNSSPTAAKTYRNEYITARMSARIMKLRLPTRAEAPISELRSQAWA